MYILNRMFSFGYLHRMEVYLQKFMKRNRRHSYPLSKQETDTRDNYLSN